jgi:hypothetical protein
MTLAMLCIGAPARAISRVSPKRVGGPSVTFDSGTVVAAQATPGSTVYFASLSLKGGDYVITVEKPTGQATADPIGVARFTLAEPVRNRSVWVVVDGATHGYTVASPPGMLLSEMTLPGNTLVTATGGLAVERAAVDVFVIRAGGGIWAAYLRDGAAIDTDHATDGVVSADVSALDPDAPGTAPLAAFQPGDIVFSVDRNSLQYFATKVGAP